MTKRVLLTGGSRGIGKVINEVFTLAGLDVVVPSREQLDLSCEASIEEFFNITPAKFDIVINNAGINIIKPILEITSEDLQLINQVNLVAPLQVIQHCVPYMREQQAGRILNVSSIWGIRSKEYRTLYSGTKFGLIGYTKALARELAEDNILVNAVCPGFIDTELTAKSLSELQKEQLLKQVPLNRLGKPEEIAKHILYLATENTFITGQATIIDGGFLS
ncbi:SDR family oxidoreductase [Pseudoalteromonas sp. SWN29]|uniref:SDR family NAD(P)-dependent oxidoreductase n=1 Tax=Pseudoalteromonas sp. SWN29 TaxID=2792064 RepID=UPI0018CC8A80|nr:SDR family NAD(P)-dependent oxidoreductase [Pseudoalteromonas sp. SWN29]MBH0028549.1 SDR family oxidoreductase [Pseudoalteromonas sp. SWN29]